MIDANIPEAETILRHYVDKALSEGGAIHPAITLHCRTDRPSDKGIMWVSGDTGGELAMFVPRALNISPRRDSERYLKSAWYRLYELCGYQKLRSMSFLATRLIGDEIIPLVDMVNDNTDCKPFYSDVKGAWLYDCEFRY